MEPAQLDLSMEVVEWLKWVVRRIDAALLAEMRLPAFTVTAPPPGTGHLTSREFAKAIAAAQQSQRRLEELWMRHAVMAVVNMLTVLRRFYPDMTPDQLSLHIHSAIYSKFVLHKADQGLRMKLYELVPRDRRKWHAYDIEAHVRAVHRASKGWHRLGMWVTSLPRDPRFQVVTISAGGGAIILGTAGVSVGFCAGATAGAMVGVVPAFVTFFMSIPVFAALGGGLGAIVGAVTGAGAGAMGGGVFGGMVVSLKSIASNSKEYTHR